MTRRILKTTIISLFAIGVAAACGSKKQDEIAGEAVAAAHDPAQCPKVDAQPTAANYSLDNSAATPAKLISVYQIQDDKDKTRMNYAISLNGVEWIVMNGTKGQAQPNGGTLTGGCQAGRFQIAGTGINGQQVRLSIATDVNGQQQKGLKVGKFHYTATNAPAASLDSIVSSFKAAVSGKDKTNTTGVPQDADIKPANAAAKPK